MGKGQIFSTVCVDCGGGAIENNWAEKEAAWSNRNVKDLKGRLALHYQGGRGCMGQQVRGKSS
jgi:hypothetical protein